MNLDKLKNLGAKLWTKDIEMFGETHEELWLRYHGNTICKPLSRDKAADALQMLNMTKEMIETIERYKATLEVISLNADKYKNYDAGDREIVVAVMKGKADKALKDTKEETR